MDRSLLNRHLESSSPSGRLHLVIPLDCKETSPECQQLLLTPASIQAGTKNNSLQSRVWVSVLLLDQLVLQFLPDLLLPHRYCLNVKRLDP